MKTSNKKKIYKYEHYASVIKMEDIMGWLEEHNEEGWEVISHNQTEHGLSIIFKRIK